MIGTLHHGSGAPAGWLKPRIAKALKVIERWLEATDRHVYASISGGKDSLVSSALIRKVWPGCPLVWVNQGPLAEWPDCVLLLERLREQGWNIMELCPSASLLTLYKLHGIPLDGTMNTRLDKIINQRLMHDPLEEYQEQNSVRGFAWGLRKESRGRTMYLRSRGELYQTKAGMWICSPVGFWSTEDIWSFIDSERLPYAAMYDRNRLTIRNGPPIGTTGINWGRLAELRRYHPEFWQEFVSHFPEIANYA